MEILKCTLIFGAGVAVGAVYGIHKTGTTDKPVEAAYEFINEDLRKAAEAVRTKTVNGVNYIKEKTAPKENIITE